MTILDKVRNEDIRSRVGQLAVVSRVEKKKTEWLRRSGIPRKGTVAVNSSALNTKVSAFFLVFSFQLEEMPFMPPFAPFVGLDSTASVYTLRGTRWQLAPLQWTFPALRCRDNAGVV